MLRRTLLTSVALAFLPKVVIGQRLSGGSPSGGGTLFTNFTINSVYSYNSGYPPKWVSGDGISPTWAADGKLYIILNDTNGNGFNGTGNGRIEVASLDGYTPPASVTGTNVFGFGGTLSGSWYLGGIIAVGSTLYMTLSDNSGTANQIVKSVDHGATWSPTPSGGGYASPIFTSKYPWGFVQYGQAYTGNGPHNSNLYVYCYFSAASGVPSNGVGVTLGRVLISNIGNLVAADWSWYQGGDGMLSGNWGAYSTSVAVFSETTANPTPYYFPTGHACYLPAFGCYIFTQSHYVGGSASNGWINYYATPTPWGPYTLVASLDMSSYGSLYQAGTAPSSVAFDGGRTITLLASGSYEDCCTNTGRYCVHFINATLS